MTSSRPGSTASLLLLNLPPSILCGIDLLSFTTTPNFCGIKDIPAGFHFVFTSESSSFSLRDGFWCHFSASSSGPSPLIVRAWDSASNSLRPVPNLESYRNQLPALWERKLSPYRQSVQKDGEEMGTPVDWGNLTNHITPALLSNLARKEDWNISSASTMPEDKEDIPGLRPEETGLEEHELGSLGIDLKRTWREGAVGRERTEGARDRSWALQDVHDRWRDQHSDRSTSWGAALLGQMQICFIMVLTVANYSCLEEWKRCLELVLTSKKAIVEHEAWYASVIKLIRLQILRCQDVEGGLFDMSDEGGGLLKKWIKEFKRTLAQDFKEDEGRKVKKEMENLEDELNRMYGWQLGDEFVRNGAIQLEDGEVVEMDMGNMDEEDESGEYAPVVVDLEGS